jgi:uncharacterized membrane protein
LSDGHKGFMEKKIKRTEKGTKSDSKKSSEEKIVIITILVAIVIMSALLVSTILLEPIETEKFTAMYILDSEKRADNYPKTVILGTNSTFTLWVGIENQNDKTIDYSVQVKLDDGTSTEDPSTAEPIYLFNKTLANEETWESPVTISIDQPGSNRIIFELYTFNQTANSWEYTGTRFNYSIEAIQA